MKRNCLGCPGYRCRTLVTRGNRCDDCQRAVWRLKNKNRPTGEREFYSSAAWRQLARATVEAAAGCATCGAPKGTVELTAGHRVAIRIDPSRALDPTAVIAQCRPCQTRAQYEPGGSRYRPVPDPYTGMPSRNTSDSRQAADQSATRPCSGPALRYPPREGGR